MRLQYCFFGATSMTKNCDKRKWIYTGYGIVFGGGALESFGNDFIDNISSLHADNFKNNFLVLGGGPT